MYDDGRAAADLKLISILSSIFLEVLRRAAVAVREQAATLITNHPDL